MELKFDKNKLNVDLHKDLCEYIHNLYCTKNSDYGNAMTSLYNELGMTPYYVMLSIKLNRLKSLAVDKNQQQVKDESILDTLLDLSNYCLLAAVDFIKEEK